MITLPSRVAAPFVSLFWRALRGDFWMESVSNKPDAGPQLRLSDYPEIQVPRDGAGPMNHRLYRVRICDSKLSPEDLLEKFRADPNRFGPTSYATFVPDPKPRGLCEGDVLQVKLPGPWDGPIYIHEVRPQRIRLNTRVGHMEAGWIEFRTSGTGEATEFMIESFARSGDEVFDALYHQVGIGKTMQTLMWVSVLETAVDVSGGQQQGRLEIETVIYEGAS